MGLGKGKEVGEHLCGCLGEAFEREFEGCIFSDWADLCEGGLIRYVS